MSKIRVTSFLTLVLLAGAAVVHADVDVRVREVAGVGSVEQPTTVVIPFAEGAHTSTASFDLDVPAQFEVLERWPADGSLRNVAMHFLADVPASSSATYTFRPTGGPPPAPTDPVEVFECTGNGVPVAGCTTAREVLVRTGPLQFTVPTTAFSVVGTVWLDLDGNRSYATDERIVTPERAVGGTMTACAGVSSGTCTPRTENDADLQAPVITIEERGPVRAVVRAWVPTRYNDTNDDGDTDDAGEYFRHGFAVRIYAYAGKPWVKVDYQLQNSAAGPSLTQAKWADPLYFKGLHLDWGLVLGGSVDVKTAKHDGTFDTRALGSSGVELAATLHDKYKIRSANASTTWVDCGNDCNAPGLVDVSDGTWGVTAVVRHFWETFPNGIEVDGSGKLSVQLFPDWGANWDYDAVRYESIYWLDDMRHVYKEFLLAFHGPRPSDTELRRLVESFRFHPVPSLPVARYRDTRATFDLEGLFPYDTAIGGSGSPVPDYAGRTTESDPGSYAMGWDRFNVDSVYRLDTPAGTGGGPTSGQYFAVTRDPADYWDLELQAMGEINARPSWMGDDYTYEDDYATIKLDESYGSPTWRNQADTADYPIAGTGHTNMPRDDQHGWHHHVAESYWFTANPWVRDWYRFLGEFREQRLTGADTSATDAQRGMGHALQEAYWAARLTGDPVLRQRIADYAALRAGNIHPQCGRVDFTASGTSGLEIGFHNQAFQSALEFFKGTDWNRWATLFRYTASQIYYHQWYNRYGYHVDQGGGDDCAVNTGGSSGTACQMVDAMAHWYHVTGDSDVLDYANDYADNGSDGGLPPYNSCGWNRANPGNNWVGNLEGRNHKYEELHPRADTTPPDPIPDVDANLDGARVNVTWTPPPSAEYYLVLWSDREIYECRTACASDPRAADTVNYRNWWAANAEATTESSIVLDVGSTDPVYVAVFAFDASDNMSRLSNVALADSGPTEPTPPSIVEQPQDQTVVEGGRATFTVRATGSVPMDYQWKRNGADIPGAIERSYTTPPLTLADDGDTFRCVVSNDLGSDTSDPAIVTVTEPGPRVTDGQVALYTFLEGAGSTVRDVSGSATPLDLEIADVGAVRWTADGLTVESSTQIASPGPATALNEAIRTSGEITIEAWIRPANLTQNGPARIVTISADPSSRNATLGQGVYGSSADRLEIRLRTSATDANGQPATPTPTGSLGLDLAHVVYTRASSGAVAVYVDDVVVSTANVGGDTSNWNTGYRFGLADEFGGGRPWLGEYRLVAVFDRALSADEVHQNFLAGPGGSTPPDDTPPTAPTGLTATPTAATQVDLAWEPATDDVGVVRYRVYRDDAFIGTSSSTSYVDATAMPETTYRYHVTAQDAAGNESAASDPASATTPYLAPPDAPVLSIRQSEGF